MFQLIFMNVSVVFERLLSATEFRREITAIILATTVGRYDKSEQIKGRWGTALLLVTVKDYRKLEQNTLV